LLGRISAMEDDDEYRIQIPRANAGMVECRRDHLCHQRPYIGCLEAPESGMRPTDDLSLHHSNSEIGAACARHFILQTRSILLNRKHRIFRFFSPTMWNSG